jgi:hypothetical protein
MASYHLGSSTAYDIKKQKDQLWLLSVSSESVKDVLILGLVVQPKYGSNNKKLPVSIGIIW